MDSAASHLSPWEPIRPPLHLWSRAATRRYNRIPHPITSPDGLTGEGMAEPDAAPTLLAPKPYDAPSVFRPENLLREARRQRGLTDTPVPAVCVLDPDGDIVRSLRATGRSQRADG